LFMKINNIVLFIYMGIYMMCIKKSSEFWFRQHLISSKFFLSNNFHVAWIFHKCHKFELDNYSFVQKACSYHKSRVTSWFRGIDCKVNFRCIFHCKSFILHKFCTNFLCCISYMHNISSFILMLKGEKIS